MFTTSRPTRTGKNIWPFCWTASAILLPRDACGLLNPKSKFAEKLFVLEHLDPVAAGSDEELGAAFSKRHGRGRPISVKIRRRRGGQDLPARQIGQRNAAIILAR